MDVLDNVTKSPDDVRAALDALRGESEKKERAVLTVGQLNAYVK